MQIRETAENETLQILQVHRAAFGGDAEAELVAAMVADPTAQPLLSLFAVDEERPLGHVLFSRAGFADADGETDMAILAPLAVTPKAQGKGIGSALVEAGLRRLTAKGVGSVFVLGDPRYYGRFGFAPAAPQGLLAPYPLPPAYAEAWMVRHLAGGENSVKGTLACCDSLMRPELWME